MPSNPLPSSARSALREAAVQVIATRDAHMAVRGERESAVTYRAYHDAKCALIKACEPDTVLALLEDSRRIDGIERGEFQIKNVEMDLNGEVSATRWSVEYDTDAADSRNLRAAIDAAILASSPTGGTTE